MITISKTEPRAFSSKTQTSISPDIAREFTSAGDCCLSQITLLPGTKCLWISGISKLSSENEILLDSDTTFLIRSHKKELNSTYNINICDKQKKNMTISDIVAL